MSTRPMRKYATKIGYYEITVHAVTKIDAMTEFQRKGVIVAVPGIYVSFPPFLDRLNKMEVTAKKP